MAIMKISQHSFLPRVANLWEDFFNKDMVDTHSWRRSVSVPAVNIEEQDRAFAVTMAVPGMQRSDFKIKVDNGVLGITSEKTETQEEQDKGVRYTRREFGYHAFHRSFALPEAIDENEITAEYKDGILAIHLPKKIQSQPQPTRQIAVR